MTETLTLQERASIVLDQQVEKRIKAGIDPRQAVRDVMDDPEFTAWIEAWANGRDDETSEQSNVIDRVLKKAEAIRLARGGDALDYIREVLASDPKLAAAYKGL